MDDGIAIPHVLTVVPATRIGRIRLLFLARHGGSAKAFATIDRRTNWLPPSFHFGGTTGWCVDTALDFLRLQPGAVALSMRRWHSADHDLVGRERS